MSDVGFYFVFYNLYLISINVMVSNGYLQPSSDKNNQNLQNFMLMSAF